MAEEQIKDNTGAFEAKADSDIAAQVEVPASAPAGEVKPKAPGMRWYTLHVYS